MLFPSSVYVPNMHPDAGRHRAFWNFWKPKETSDHCQIHADCPGDQCCSQTTRKCVKRSNPNANTDCNLMATTEDVPNRKPLYPIEWEYNQGDQGFNAYARSLLEDANLSHSLSCSREDGDRWYQRAVAYLVHPRTPISRILVAHQLGTGKTITMLRVLDNFFDDPHEVRPRVLLFPTETIAENFYRELATQPNRYRDWLQTIPNGRRWPVLKDDDTTRQEPEQMIALEDERRAFVEWAREELAKWPINVGRHRNQVSLLIDRDA